MTVLIFFVLFLTKWWGFRHLIFGKNFYFLLSSAANEKRAFDLDDDVYAEYVEQLLTELHKNPDDDLQKFLDDAEDRKLEMDVNEYYEW